MTESESKVYYVDGKESTTPPEKTEGLRVWVQDRDFTNRTAVTLWNRATGEKLYTATCDRAFSGGDESPLKIAHRKAFLWDVKTRTTSVIDLVARKELPTLPGFVQYIAQDESFLILQEGSEISICDAKTLTPYCTVPGRTVRMSKDQSRFITWSEHMLEATVYELKTGKKINSFPKGDALVLNGDGTKLLIRRNYFGEVGLFDVDAKKELWSVRFGGSEKDSYTFRFSEDGKIISGSCDLRLPVGSEDYPRTYVWDTKSGKEIKVFGHLFMDRYFGKVNRMLGSLPVGDMSSKTVLCDATTGEVITENFTGYFDAVSKDEQRFLTHGFFTEDKKNTFSLWDSKTGKLLRTIENENIVPNKTNFAFDADPGRIRLTTPVERMDSRFVSQEMLLDIDTEKIVERKDILPETRSGGIVWKAEESNVVFWNLEDGQAFFTIRLSPPERRFGANIIGPIHFTPDGKELIYSTKMVPFMQRVIF
jgi:WD40 repeat protein